MQERPNAKGQYLPLVYVDEAFDFSHLNAPHTDVSGSVRLRAEEPVSGDVEACGKLRRSK